MQAFSKKEKNNEIIFLCQNRMDCIRGRRCSFISLSTGREPKGISVIPICDVTNRLFFMDRQPFEKHFGFDKKAFEPDLIIGHSGFGNTLYLKEVWPNAKFIGYFEWFYRSQGADVGFGSDQAPSPDTSLRVHTYNSPIVMDLAQADAAICPTRWQADQFPQAMRRQLSVIFDGVDTQQLPLVRQKDRFHALDLQSGDKRVSIPADAPLVTYVTHCFEPYRGWPQVAEGLALLMQRNPRAHILSCGFR